MGKHLLFVSTSNLATNPRLVKEIELALAKGYRVTAVVCRYANWSSDLHEQLKARFEKQIALVEADASRRPLFTWLLSSCLQQVQRLKQKAGISGARVLSDVLIKRSILLRWKLGELQDRYDLVIAHNPGAFEPAARFAARHKIPLGIDVEDYHPGETTNEAEAGMMRALQQMLLPAAAYVSAASPLILAAVEKDCAHRIRNGVVVLNYFNREEFREPVTGNEVKLRCVWFSQNIAAKRGLEELAAVVKTLEGQVELHLYGNLHKRFYDAYLAAVPDIYIHDPLPQEQLHRALSQYDVGLALENKAININRSICIANKFLAYYQAGLYILATDTEGQRQFLNEHPAHGTCTTLEELSNTLAQIIQDKEAVRASARIRFNTASTHNASSELERLQQLWAKLTNDLH